MVLGLETGPLKRQPAVKPGRERRRQAGHLPEAFELHAAQVIFDMELDAPKVRLNEEVKAVFKARANQALEAGEAVRWADITELVVLQLTDQDPNAGHLTVLRKPDGWWITFDFRYNATRIAETVQAVGPEVENEGRRWRLVRIYDGAVGWMPSQYLVAAP